MSGAGSLSRSFERMLDLLLVPKLYGEDLPTPLLLQVVGMGRLPVLLVGVLA